MPVLAQNMGAGAGMWPPVPVTGNFEQAAAHTKLAVGAGYLHILKGAGADYGHLKGAGAVPSKFVAGTGHRHLLKGAGAGACADAGHFEGAAASADYRDLFEE